MFYAIVELGDKYAETCTDCPLWESCTAYKEWTKDLYNAVLPCNDKDACMIKEVIDT